MAAVPVVQVVRVPVPSTGDTTVDPQQVTNPNPVGSVAGSDDDPGSCAVDDVFDLHPGSADGSASAPGVLANDTCTRVVSNTSGVVTQGRSLEQLVVNEDGSFSYIADAAGTSFTFTYTTETGETATVTVNHNL